MIFNRFAAATVAALLTILTACSGASAPAPASSQPKTTVTPMLSCEGSECGADGKEVKTTPCAASAIDAYPALPVTGVDARGEMSIRKSTVSGAECDRYYWGKFEAEANTGPYVLEIIVSKDGLERKGSQASEPNNPASGALTIGLKARVGQKVQVCVKDNRTMGGRFCRDVDVV